MNKITYLPVTVCQNCSKLSDSSTGKHNLSNLSINDNLNNKEDLSKIIENCYKKN